MLNHTTLNPKPLYHTNIYIYIQIYILNVDGKVINLAGKVINLVGKVGSWNLGFRV